MKKIITILIACAGTQMAAADNNPFFGTNRHQVSFNLGTGVNSSYLVPPPSQFVPFALFHIGYSLPTDFFEMHARKSLNLAGTYGYDEKYGWDFSDCSSQLVFISEDIAILHGQKWYAGTGAAVGMQSTKNDRIGSKLIFGFKLFAGYSISENMNAEIFVQHFSNGSTTDENKAYGFYGLGLSYNF